MSELEQQSERRHPLPSRGQLIDIMFTFDICMQQIGITFMDHVHLSYEDPETFGGGHYVLYAKDGGTSRFAIEEQYTDTDWSDPGRVSTSWIWRDERETPREDGTLRWTVRRHGEIQPRNFGELLLRAEAWAQATSDLASRAKALDSGPAKVTPVGAAPTNAPVSYESK